MFSCHWQGGSRCILIGVAIAFLACIASIACASSAVSAGIVASAGMGASSAASSGANAGALASVPAAKAGTAWGSHGMAVFGGNEALYASHLPMFHAPHDYQVILRFHLQDAANHSALKQALASKPELWTLDPEPFDLGSLAPGAIRPLKQFSATLVQGHFERHGQPRFHKQNVIVDEVLLFRSLATFATSQPGPSAGRYHLIGRCKEQFLVKEIDRRPDFDLILALPPRTTTPAALNARPGTQPGSRLSGQITLPSPGLQAPTTADWEKVLPTRPVTLYFETDDLK